MSWLNSWDENIYDHVKSIDFDRKFFFLIQKKKIQKLNNF